MVEDQLTPHGRSRRHFIRNVALAGTGVAVAGYIGADYVSKGPLFGLAQYAGERLKSPRQQLLDSLGVDNPTPQVANLIDGLGTYLSLINGRGIINKDYDTVISNYGKDNVLRAVNAVKKHPNINRDFSQYGYGNDWLVQFLQDNPGDEQMWRAVNALGLQAELICYYASPIDNPGTGIYNNTAPTWFDQKYDDTERNKLFNPRWRQYKSWVQSGEVLVKPDDSIADKWSALDTQIANLRSIIMPWAMFYQDASHPVDTGYFGLTTVDTAIKNMPIFDLMHPDLWKYVKDPSQVAEGIAANWKLISSSEGPTTLRYYSKYLSVMEQSPYLIDKSDIAINGHVIKETLTPASWENSPVGPENIIDQTIMEAASIGGACYRMWGTHPHSYPQEHHDIGTALSDRTKNIFYNDKSTYGTPIIDPLTNALSFWVNQESCMADGIPFVKIDRFFNQATVWKA